VLPSAPPHDRLSPSAHNQFYLPEIAGCWKLDGSPCDGALSTDWPKADITRYLCFIVAPSVTPHCSAKDQKYCPPWHIMSADGSKVYRNDTERFPYSCYYEHCWAPNDPTVPEGEVIPATKRDLAFLSPWFSQRHPWGCR